MAIAIAQKRLGKDPTKTLERAAKLNVPAKPIDWNSATSCYRHVSVAVGSALIVEVGGDIAAAKALLSEARKTFQQVHHKGVRSTCDEQLANPANPEFHGSLIARLAGFGDDSQPVAR